MSEGYFEKHINRMKALYNKKYSKMKSLIERSPYIEMHGSNSGMSFVAGIPGVEPGALLGHLRNAGVRIVPVADFAVNGGDFKELYLLSFSRLGGLEEIKEGIGIIEDTAANSDSKMAGINCILQFGKFLNLVQTA